MRFIEGMEDGRTNGALLQQHQRMSLQWYDECRRLVQHVEQLSPRKLQKHWERRRLDLRAAHGEALPQHYNENKNEETSDNIKKYDSKEKKCGKKNSADQYLPKLGELRGVRGCQQQSW